MLATLTTTRRRGQAPAAASAVAVDRRPAVVAGRTTRRAGAPPGPGPGVRRVLDGEAALAQLERRERVDHDGRLVEVLDPQARLDRAGLRAVRVAAGVQADRADADPRALAGLVVAADVEHDLVGVDVGVVVGHRDGEVVVVDLAGQEVADDEVPALEDLVHRRRLVDLAGDRHVVLDVERVGVEAAVPADDVEWVRRIGEAAADDAGTGAVLHEDLDVRALGLEGLGGTVEVALAVGRVLEELAEAREVAPGRV